MKLRISDVNKDRVSRIRESKSDDYEIIEKYKDVNGSIIAIQEYPGGFSVIYGYDDPVYDSVVNHIKTLDKARELVRNTRPKAKLITSRRDEDCHGRPCDESISRKFGKELRESDYRPMSEVTTKLITDRQAQTKDLVDSVVDLATKLEEAVNVFVPVAIEDVENFDPNYQDMRILSNSNCIARVNKFLQNAIDDLARCHPEELLDVDFYKNGKVW